MPFKSQWQYKVVLACGHQLTLRQQPLNRKVTYGCPAQPRCGYNVRWKSATDTKSNVTITNTEV